MSYYVVAQVHPHFPPSYLSAFEGDGSISREWERAEDRAFRFPDRRTADNVALTIKSGFRGDGGWTVEARLATAATASRWLAQAETETRP